MKKVPDTIDDSETVARIIFSPSHIHNGRISPKAFRLEHLPGGAEDYISVLRDEESRLPQVAEGFRVRTPGDRLYGYTLLNAGSVRSLTDEAQSREVKLLPRPSRRLPWHAGIYLYLAGELQTADSLSPDIDLFQKELSLLCDGPHKF